MKIRAYGSVFTKQVKSVEELIKNRDAIGDSLAQFSTLTLKFEKLRSLGIQDCS